MYKKCMGRKLISYFVEMFYLKMFLSRTKPERFLKTRLQNRRITNTQQHPNFPWQKSCICEGHFIFLQTRTWNSAGSFNTQKYLQLQTEPLNSFGGAPPSFYKWRKVYRSKDLSLISVKSSRKGAAGWSVLLFPLFVLMEVSPCRLMSVLNWIPQYFVISGKLYLPKKTTWNFGLDDNANIYQYVLILVITPKFEYH